jgi:hypothetical protein
MSYTSGQIVVILSKADKTLYRLGSVAYEDMFAENSETADYIRDIIYIYKRAIEYADDFYVGTVKLDQVVERLSTLVNIYSYGTLTPIYSSAYTSTSVVVVDVYVRKDTPIVTDQGIIAPADFSGDTINLALNYTYIKSQTRDYYVHDQQQSSASWVVNHNLNKFASVNVVDTANSEIIADVTYNSANQLTITFSTPISGKAYIN